LLSIFGPLSLIGLLAMWAATLVLGFALCQYGLGSNVAAEGNVPGLPLDLYLSGTTFFTLGLGDAVPTSWAARALIVIEGGVGFGFLAIVIGYLPVTYQAFSRREVIISMLDARAGSPSMAVELLRRHAEDHTLDAMDDVLRDWEHWSAELLESHLSYPVLAYFRSQHDNQSWLAALTTILDACAIVMAGIKGHSSRQAKLTFAIARHAVVDLSQVFHARPNFQSPDRLDKDGLDHLHTLLQASGLEPEDPQGVRLGHLRTMYEPYVHVLSNYLKMDLPLWIPTTPQKDNWQTTAWDRHR
jgi:hypothetical protein